MIVDIYNTENRYDLIVADPAWQQSRGGKKSVRKNSSGKPLDYPVCSLDEIKENDYIFIFFFFVDTFEEEELIDIDEVKQNIANIEAELAEVQAQMKKYMEELGL